MRCSDSLTSLPPCFVSFARRLPSLAPVFVTPAKSDADLGPGGLGLAPPHEASSWRDGDARASQVPGEPFCACALLLDPGETNATRPLR